MAYDMAQGKPGEWAPADTAVAGSCDAVALSLLRRRNRWILLMALTLPVVLAPLLVMLP